MAPGRPLLALAPAPVVESLAPGCLGLVAPPLKLPNLHPFLLPIQYSNQPTPP